MGGFFQSPTFSPSVPPIPLGSTGQVLTMQAGGFPRFAAGGGGAAFPTFTSLLTPTLGGVTTNNWNPAGFSNAANFMIDVTSDGNADTITGLVAGASGQLVLLTNVDAVNNITLSNSNGASSAGNQFFASGDFILPPGNMVMLCYNSNVRGPIGASWRIL